MENGKETVVQAVVIMDLFNSNFKPLTHRKPMGLFSVAGIHLIDYVLGSLVSGGVNEAILFCCQDVLLIKEHVKKSKENKVPWSLLLVVHIISSDTCQTMGDVMREIDAASLVRGYFVLLGINAVTNTNFAALLEEHRQTCKKDKGAAMTLVYKEVAKGHPLISNDEPHLLAADSKTNKILFYQKYKPKSREAAYSLPLECVLSHSEVQLHHNLVDTNIVLCSPSVPPLFSDNFDFQTKYDFIHGILINEDILACSLYSTFLKGNEYAAAITNWKTYQTVCCDILHNWVEPLTIDSGSLLKNNYLNMGNYIFRKPTSTLSRSCTLEGDILIGSGTHISDMSCISKTMIGDNCTIGNNVVIQGSYIMDNVIIKDNCQILNSFIDSHSQVEENCNLQGVIASSSSNIQSGSQLKGNIIDDSKIDFDNTTKLAEQSGTEWENESSNDGDDDFVGFEMDWSDSESNYSSDSSDECSMPNSPVPDDTNIFLQEVIDSLARGYEEGLKCDYLILEINSSRYAYNINLGEVHFFVIKALLSMPVLSTSKSVLSTVKGILKHFHPILANYIKTKSSIMDCLRAVEDSCINNEGLVGKAGQIIHLLYDADVVDEDSLLEWYESLKKDKSPVLQQSTLVKFFAWLQEASEESEESD